MFRGWQIREMSKFNCNQYLHWNGFGGWGNLMSPNDIRLFGGYSDNGRKPYESYQTAWARSGAESAYYNYSKDFWNAQSKRLDPWSRILYSITDGLGNYFNSPAGAQMTLALGAGITAKVFGFSGDLFKTGAEKTKKKEKENHDSDTNIECTC